MAPPIQPTQAEQLCSVQNSCSACVGCIGSHRRSWYSRHHQQNFTPLATLFTNQVLMSKLKDTLIFAFPSIDVNIEGHYNFCVSKHLNSSPPTPLTAGDWTGNFRSIFPFSAQIQREISACINVAFAEIVPSPAAFIPLYHPTL